MFILKTRKNSRLKYMVKVEQIKYEGNNRIKNKLVKMKVEQQ